MRRQQTRVGAQLINIDHLRSVEAAERESMTTPIDRIDTEDL